MIERLFRNKAWLLSCNFLAYLCLNCGSFIAFPFLIRLFSELILFHDFNESNANSSTHLPTHPTQQGITCQRRLFLRPVPTHPTIHVYPSDPKTSPLSVACTSAQCHLIHPLIERRHQQQQLFASCGHTWAARSLTDVWDVELIESSDECTLLQSLQTTR